MTSTAFTIGQGDNSLRGVVRERLRGFAVADRSDPIEVERRYDPADVFDRSTEHLAP